MSEPRIHHGRIRTGTDRCRARISSAPSGHGASSCSSATSIRRHKSLRLLPNCANLVGDADAPVLIDQEGGRVQRLGPPHWPVYPPGAVFGALYDIDPAARPDGGAPELPADRGRPGRSRHQRRLPAAGGRAGRRRRRRDRQPGLWHRTGQGRGDRPRRHRRAGAGRRAAGPEAHSRPWQGHGGQPFQAADGRYAPKRSWNGPISPRSSRLADLPMAMTAHVVFSALDPAQPATTSATIIEQVIRGVIGFQGLLMSDDVSMNALAGSIAERTRAIVDGRLRHGPALQRQAR